VQGHQGQAANALGLEGSDEALDDGDGAVLANGAEAGLDLEALAPRLEGVAEELRPLVEDGVPGLLAGLVWMPGDIVGCPGTLGCPGT